MDLEIAVNARDVYGKQNKRLRTTGVVPGVLFGKKIGSIPVQVDAKALELLYHQAKYQEGLAETEPAHSPE